MTRGTKVTAAAFACLVLATSTAAAPLQPLGAPMACTVETCDRPTQVAGRWIASVQRRQVA